MVHPTGCLEGNLSGDGSQWGIVIDQDQASLGTVGTNINYNLIHMQDSMAQVTYGVGLYDLPFISDTLHSINNNTIFMDNSATAYGTYLYEVQRYAVALNNVYLSTGRFQPERTFGNGMLSPAYYGIYNNGTGMNVNCNTISGLSQTNATQSAIYSIYTSGDANYLYKCNFTDYTTEGFYFNTGVSQGFFQSNKMKRHYFGLHVDYNAYMSPQTHEGNEWLVNSKKLSAYDENPNYKQDRFKINSTSTIYFPPPTERSPQDWFINALGTDSTCGASCSPPPNGGGSGGWGRLLGLDLLIAEDSIQTPQYNNTIVWQARRSLMEKLMADTSLISADTAFRSFYNAHLNDNIGALSSIRLQMDSLHNVDATTLASIQNNLETINANALNIAEYDSILTNDASLSSDEIAEIDALIASYNGYISVATAANDSIYNSIRSIVSTRAAAIMNENDTLSSTLIYEQNEITVNSICLPMSINSQMAEELQEGTGGDTMVSYMTQLYNIASQCAWSGGDAVYYARSIYHLINDSIMFDDSRICNSASDTCIIPPAPGFISGRALGVCGQEFQYSINAMSNATSYTWSLTGNASIDSGQGSTSLWVSFTDTFTTGTINVYATDSCGSGSVRTLIVTGYPAAPDSISGPPAVCSFALNVAFSTDSVESATGYMWTVPSGCVIDSGQGTTRIVVDWDSLPGSLIVVASDSCGTSDSTIYTVGINECRIAAERAVINNPTSGDVKLYPNPSNGKVTLIYHLSSNNGVLQLFDIVGKMIGSYQLDANQNRFEFDMGDLCCGIFQYRVLDNQTVKGQGKLVIIR